MASSDTINRSLPDHLMHKNRLQQHTQKSGLQLPVYQTMNEGFQHAPKFRSTVLVDGVKYISMSTFTSVKEAEQDVAKHALDRITKRINNEGCPLIHQDPLICKSVLHEFAVKMDLKSPKFTTKIAEGVGPAFVSSLIFDGKEYIGDVSGSKKMAEQLAARNAIQSLLGSNSGNLLNQIIKSKDKRNASSHTVRDLGVSKEIFHTAAQPEGSSRQLSNVVPSDTSFNSDCTTVHAICGAKRGLELENLENKKTRSHRK